MKVLMVMQHINFFRNLETVVRELDARGHEVVMLHGTKLDDPKTKKKLERKKQKMVFMGRGIEVAEAQLPGMSSGYRVEPEERWQRRLRTARQVMNCALYLRKDHPSPDRVTEGLVKRLPPGGQRLLRNRLARMILRRKWPLRLWRRLEGLVPASRTVMAVLADARPDVILVSPTIWPKSPVEADYIRAARALALPTIGYLNSWDNLTSKGTVHVLPDVFVVWNEALAEEAETIHQIPRRRIEVTGAPHADHFFSMQPSGPHVEICRAMGCPEDRPYVVFLCSSRTLIDSEVEIVDALVDALEDRLGGDAPTVVVRPHPVNPGPWEEYERPGVAVCPKLGDQADTPQAWQAYYDQLHGARCFVGLNTTAFLEAAVADRPCVTIVAEEFAAVQGKTGHFRHLLAGDFLEVCTDMAAVAACVAAVLDGEDVKAEARRAFVESFLRPRGLETRAAVVVADLIEEVALAQHAARGRERARESQRHDLVLAAEDDAR